jgi:hypothetical protein
VRADKSHREVGELDKADAKMIQKVVWDTVQEYLKVPMSKQ